MNTEPIAHPASFRDPSGIVFEWNGKIYRQINNCYAADFDLLMQSGLYEKLVSNKLLIAHHETTDIIFDSASCYKTICPEQLAFISYPYEWCFGQLRDAALTTLTTLRIAVEHGMILKDASPYNIQFNNGLPVFIDTASFERYDPRKTWVAYRQFCKMFLFPLYLEYYLKTDIQKIMSAYPEGIPPDITAKLLPLKSGLNLGVWLHVYLQNTVSAGAAGRSETESFSQKKLMNLISHLESTITNLNTRMGRSEWSDYYNEEVTSKEYLDSKQKIFTAIIRDIKVRSAVDLGANNGLFARILSSNGVSVVATDYDSRSISTLYDDVKKNELKNILPLILDVASPSPAIGFDNKERASFHDRINTELVTALALLHHLVIGRNITLPMLAEYFRRIAPMLIIEWIPREDEKVQQMLASRKDVFTDYTQDNFEKYFSQYFDFERKIPVEGSKRVVYFLLKK